MSQQVDDLQEQLSGVLGRAGTSIAVAESLTGGELSAEPACAPGSVGWFRAGIVAHATGRSALGWLLEHCEDGARVE